ncbi:hypothetical protein GCM10010365_34780 [Streptomyces poonensis]|uniref:ABC transporter domain-containing protein n=1 Tax=Streptomyces poonensis TaxID=68255 RepID=A0A918PKR6_9ACTN|nr:hypothetical protein GCM10010365_34780 [Streptomyces poonensis]GLJ93755.1 hypothetical protein GCM10017589_63710 [Streptomyces poonensis]
MISTRPRPVTGEVTSPDAVRLSSVVKRFTDAKGERFSAVDGIDLRIRRSEIVAFLGPNGAGKTTTIDMLLGLTRPDEGSVELFGREPQQAVRSGQVAAVLQTGGLLPDLTVEATVRMLGSLHPGSDVDAVLVRAGLDGLRGRRVVECSGGEQQRLRFALALLPGPELLVLDVCMHSSRRDRAPRRRAWWPAGCATRCTPSGCGPGPRRPTWTSCTSAAGRRPPRSHAPSTPSRCWSPPGSSPMRRSARPGRRGRWWPPGTRSGS